MHHSLVLAAGLLSSCLFMSSAKGITTTRLEGNPAANNARSSAKQQQQQQHSKAKSHQSHTLFVWDFDWTVVNCNSDEYIPAQFLDEETLNQSFSRLYKSTNGDWHKCAEAVVLQAIQEGNATPASLLQAAEQMPYLTGVRQALDSIEQQCRNEKAVTTTNQMIISDGNHLFIGAFLEKQGLKRHFGYGVISNEGQWTTIVDDGNDNSVVGLKVIHQSQQYGGHSCDRCSKNLCKTQALQKTLLAQQHHDGQRPRIVYVGDGANDACPALNVLGEEDVMLARVGRKRSFANTRKGPETDAEAMVDENNPGSAFGVVPALKQAKEESGAVPSCRVLEWRSGNDLKLLVEQLLAEMK